MKPRRAMGRIPKGFWLAAHGCEERATLAPPDAMTSTQKGLWHSRSDRSRNPFGVDAISSGIPRVARASQPWAEVLNLFGIAMCRAPVEWMMIEFTRSLPLLLHRQFRFPTHAAYSSTPPRAVGASQSSDRSRASYRA